ncbi:MAG: Mbeg1-like protein [Bacilli bacterium]
MQNIFEYVSKYGKLDFSQKGFTEIDGLVMAVISYIPFENIVSDTFAEQITIKEANILFRASQQNKDLVLFKRDILLLDALANSIRYGDLKLCKFIKKINEIKEEQFSAITIVINPETCYVSYSGTDITFVGWKENFNMIFVDVIPAQLDAKKYLLDLLNESDAKHFYLGGHSKGGNLAIFAGYGLEDKFNNRLVNIYNFDGPGFKNETVVSEAYLSIIKKLRSYVPQGSVVGMILEHHEGFKVIGSYYPGIIQHDYYSWKITDDHFLLVNDVKKESLIIYNSIHDWLDNMSMKQRKTFVNSIYMLIMVTKDKTTHEFYRHGFKSAAILIRAYQKIPKEDKKLIKRALILLFKALNKNRKLLNKNSKALKREMKQVKNNELIATLTN